MNKIILTLPDDKIVTGKQVSFVAPCGSIDTECLTIRGADFTVCNASGVDVAGTNAWASGAIVSVILNVEDHRAYIQNASSSAIVCGTEEVADGAASPYPEGTLYVVIE